MIYIIWLLKSWLGISFTIKDIEKAKNIENAPHFVTIIANMKIATTNEFVFSDFLHDLFLG